MLKRIVLSFFGLSILTGLIILSSCRNAVVDEKYGADTLAAVAANAETVINSIKEKAFKNPDGYAYRKIGRAHV